MGSVSEFFDELRRRNVLRVAALYIVAAWVVLQVAELALGSWGLSADWLRYIWVVAVIGFPLSIVFGWTYDIKNGRIVRTRPANAGDKSDLSLRRTDHVLLGAMAIVLVAVVYGTVRQAQLEYSINTTDRVSTSVSTWTEADMLFRRQANWLGGDSSVSVDLGGGRVLWLFGDSFVASVTGQSRAESTMVSNTVAIQQGYDPSSAPLKYYWRTNYK